MSGFIIESYQGQHLLADLLSAKLYPQLNDCCRKVADLKVEVAHVAALSGSIIEFEKLMEQCQAEFQSLLKTNSTEDLATSLATLVRQLDASQVKTTYEQLGDMPFLESEVRTHCLEIVKEACANAIKHGQAKRLNLLLSAGQEEVKISISDNGNTNEAGFSNEGKGLQNMQQRAKSMGARLAMRTNSYGGKTLELVLTNFKEIRVNKRRGALRDENSLGWLTSLRHRFKNKKAINVITSVIEQQHSDVILAVYKVGKSQWAFEVDDRKGGQIDEVMKKLKEQADQYLSISEGDFHLLHKGGQYGVALLWIDKMSTSAISALLKLRTPVVTKLHQELGQTLHDSYCQNLVGASMAIQLLMESLDPELHDVWQRMKIISLSITKSLEGARDLSHALLDYGQGHQRENPLIT